MRDEHQTCLANEAQLQSIVYVNNVTHLTRYARRLTAIIPSIYEYVQCLRKSAWHKFHIMPEQ